MKGNPRNSLVHQLDFCELEICYAVDVLPTLGECMFMSPQENLAHCESRKKTEILGIVIFYFFEMGFYLLAQFGLEFVILLTQPPQCWEFRLVPTHPANCFLKQTLNLAPCFSPAVSCTFCQFLTPSAGFFCCFQTVSLGYLSSILWSKKKKKIPPALLSSYQNLLVLFPFQNSLFKIYVLKIHVLPC